MFDRALTVPWAGSKEWRDIQKAVQTGMLPCSIFGLSDGLKIYLAMAGRQLLDKSVLLVVSHDEHAMRMADDLAGLTGERVAVFPARPLTLHRAEAISREMMDRRIVALGQVLTGRARIVVASMEALMMPLPPREAFMAAIMTLSQGQQMDMGVCASALVHSGYRREERVEGPGQFAIRGGILDIFPVNEEAPVRIEFFDDEVDSLRYFDPFTQRSMDPVSSVTLYPATELPLSADVLLNGIDRIEREGREAVLRLRRGRHAVEDAGMDNVLHVRSTEAPWERMHAMISEELESLRQNGRFEGMENYLPCFYSKPGTLADYLTNAITLMDEPSRCAERCRNVLTEQSQLLQDALAQGRALPVQGGMMSSPDDVLFALEKTLLLTMHSMDRQTEVIPKTLVHMECRGMHTFRGQFDMLRTQVQRWKASGTRVLMMAGGAQRAKRLQDTLYEYDVIASVLENDREIQPSEVAILPLSIGAGFEVPDLKWALVSEREIYGATRQHQGRKRVRKKQGLDIFTDLVPGDFIVHEAFGIGKYEGMVKMTHEGATRDYLKIAYRDNDVLYVPTEQMDRVQKYVGTEGKDPKINRLGGTEWRTTKSRVQKHIDDIAEDLLKLYAQRQASKGHAYSQDTDWQAQFEESFPYEETPDQLQVIEEIKADMESGRTMDRLLCGDVGYGKTEVALRAIFKAVMDKKQVAFLAPTTILAHQHFATMKRRFEGFGMNVEVLSRFRSAAEMKTILERVRSGQVDAVAGTHRLLSKDVVFKDLGLLVVDEEQRFGVTHKERIKQMKASIDVLTLTATPIPRTLHMSMVGIRDISVIDTPPEDRYPVQTFVLEYEESLVRDAILREMARGGQVFFVYNKVQTIQTMRDRLQSIVPEARIGVGHGQMHEHELEQVMMDFLDGKYDVLLSTTIIESGLDIPRANTLVVYDADKFGLSQLYQLRGRVGRSNKLAYAYFTYMRDKVLTEVAEKRLVAIREFTEFGSGFRIALRDLEIRGAGNLLGAEQHGHMTAVGYGLFCRLIEETMAKLRGESEGQTVDTTLDMRFDAHIPEDYIKDGQDRLDIYRHIAAIRTPAMRQDVTDELIDRFGDIPVAVLRLMDIAELRTAASKAGIEHIRQQGPMLILRFSTVARPDPSKLLAMMQRYHGRSSLTATEPPTLRLRLNKQEETSAFDAVKTLVEEIVLCI